MARIATIYVPKPATVAPGDVTGAEFAALEADVASLRSGYTDNTYLARIAGQWVWRKLERLDPTSPAYGMSTSGSDTANDAALLAASSDAVASGAVVAVPAGEYPAFHVDLPSGTVLEGGGPDAVRLVRTQAAANHVPVLAGSGAAESAIALAADAARGATTITLASAPGWATGDRVYLTSTRAPWGGTIYPDHELVTVESVGGTTVTLAEPLIKSFATADSATALRYTPWRGRIAGLGIDIDPSITGQGIDLLYAEGAEIGDVAVTGWSTNGIRVRRSRGVRVDRADLADPPDTSGGHGYGINVIEGSRGTDIGHAAGWRCRHLIVVSYGAMFTTVHDSEGNASPQGADFDVHGAESWHTRFVGCVVRDPATNIGFQAGNSSFGGDFHTLFERCVGYGRRNAGGASAMFRAIYGSHHTIFRDCEAFDGYYGMQAHASEGVRMLGGGVHGTYAAAITTLDATGGTISGMTLVDAGTDAVVTQGTSDYWSIVGNQVVNAGRAAPISLVGANNVEVGNVIR